MITAIQKRNIILFTLGGVALITGSFIYAFVHADSRNKTFDGKQAYEYVLTQMEFGPRTVGSEAHDKASKWIQKRLRKSGWKVEIQNSECMGHPIQNLFARRGDLPIQIIIGAHYDSRLVADRDPNQQTTLPVPGANDGASGVAILLELARTLPHDTVPVGLLFIDAEDNGNLPGWDWLLGSRTFVESLTFQPQAVIIVDMVGDADLNIYKEYNSDQELMKMIWKQAFSLGYERYFLPEYKYSMLDDHTPFLEAGIPAVDIIDFDYPYWHTSVDIADKVSVQSLEVVGRTLWAWVVAQK